jgi:phage head maturation protease
MEVSAVTFPAYSQTSIQTRGLADALDGAKASLESVKAEKLEIERRRLALKNRILNGGILS